MENPINGLFGGSPILGNHHMAEFFKELCVTWSGFGPLNAPLYPISMWILGSTSWVRENLVRLRGQTSRVCIPGTQKNQAIFRVGPLDLRIGGSFRQFLSETSRVVPDIFGQTSRTACFLRICERGPSKVRQQIPHIVDPNGEFILFGINQ